MEKNIKVSIIIPIYNGAEFLRRSFDCAIYQTMSQIEVLAVNDCSPNSRDGEIMREYAEMYPDKFRCFWHETNTGQGGARNTGIRNARGEYFLCIDQDDFFDLDMCEKMYAAARDAAADMAVCDCRLLAKGSRTENWLKNGEFISDDLCDRIGNLSNHSVWILLMKRSVVMQKELFFLENMGYEDLICVMWYISAKKIVRVHDEFYNVVRHNGNNSLNYSFLLGGAYVCRYIYSKLPHLERDRRLSKVLFCYLAEHVVSGLYVAFVHHYILGEFQIMSFDIDDEFSGAIKELNEIFAMFGMNLDYEFPQMININIPSISSYFRTSLNASVQQIKELFSHYYYYQYDTEKADKILKCIGKFKEVAVWGAGIRGKRLIQLLSDGSVNFCVTDTNADLHGVDIRGGVIIKPWSEVKNDVDLVIVTPKNAFAAVRNEIAIFGSKPQIVSIDDLSREVFTFDVFDTIITRRTATPQGIFSIVESKLMVCSDFFDIDIRVRENFCLLRIVAEKVAASNHLAKTNIDHIYEELSSQSNITSAQAMRVKGLELQVEYDNSLPILQNIEIVRQALKDENYVAFVSDMYLPSEFIIKLICKHVPEFSNIRCFVSNEYGEWKASGNLFRCVEKYLGINKDILPWVHIGDNADSDVVGAEKFGIKHKLFPFTVLHLFEKNLLNSYSDDADLQTCIGAARNARLVNGVCSGKFNNEYVYGCSYAAPVLFNYINYILSKCKEKSIKRLYFISRDGYILKFIADYIIDKLKLDIKTKYIYLSRKAIIPAAFTQELSISRHILNLNGLSQYFNIAVDSLKSYAPQLKIETLFKESDYLQLNCNVELKKVLFESQNTNRNIVKDYLMQEVDVSDNKFAFIDLCGTGETLSAVRRLIASKCDDKFTVFYLHYFRSINDKDIDLIYYPVCFTNSLGLENLCRAPHGVVIGYGKIDDVVVPIFGQREFETFDFDKYKEGISDFITKYSEVEDFTIGDCPGIVDKYINFLNLNMDFEIKTFHAIFKHGVNEGKLSRHEPEINYFNGNIYRSIVIINKVFNNIVVWGAGKQGKRLAKFLTEVDIKFNVTDKDSRKHGLTIEGVVVKSWKELKDNANLIIVSALHIKEEVISFVNDERVVIIDIRELLI